MTKFMEIGSASKPSGRPLVSVAIAFYNQEAFVAETLDSIIQQDYRPIQIVCSDDASTDRTPDILKEFSSRYNFINILINKENLGITGNFNKALQGCDGELIALTGGDDLMLPGKITSQVDFLHANLEVSICCTNAEVFDSDTGRVMGVHNDPSTNPPIFGDGGQLIKGNALLSSSMMFRKKCMPRGGFNARIPIASDWLFMIEVALAGKIGYLDRIFTKYRRHQGNITRKIDTSLEEEFETLRIIKEKYPEQFDAVKIGEAYALSRVAQQFERAGEFRTAAKKMKEALSMGIPKNLYSVLYSIDPRIVQSVRKIKNILIGKPPHWSHQ